MKVEYKITFELQGYPFGNPKESYLAECVCALIDQGKSTGEEFTTEELAECLNYVKDHIGKFDLEAREVSK